MPRKYDFNYDEVRAAFAFLMERTTPGPDAILLLTIEAFTLALTDDAIVMLQSAGVLSHDLIQDKVEEWRRRK
jgi:hypothetical protein